MTFLRAAICAALFLTVLARGLAAQDVTLSSPDGAVEITGTLLGFDGEFYRVQTQFGELTVDGSGVACDGPGCPSLSAFVAEITFAGSSAMSEVMLPALIEGFALRNGYQTQREPLPGGNFSHVLLRGQKPAARFTFAVSNTDAGFAALVADEADIAMATREIRLLERKAARAAGLGDLTGTGRSRILALDAFVPVVAPANPVREITLPQLAGILTGRINNWQVLGGPDAPISIHMPVSGSGLSQAVEDKLMAPSGAGFTSKINRHDRSSTLVRRVLIDPFAIGIASYAERGAARVLTLSGPCGFSLQASRQAVKTEDYPLTVPMFLYLPARRLPKVARDFLAYVRGPAAQAVIRRAGFVDQAPELIPVSRQGNRLSNAILAADQKAGLAELQRLVTALGGMRRLTATFRFEPGSSRPDAQSRSNIEQLARALEAGEFDAQELVFAGFSDGVGPADGNRQIAMKRAAAVRDAVIKAAETADVSRVKIRTEGFGEVLPMACDDSDWGRQINRRVEVWVR
ncbi:phosphate ABC transporter substrate-binding/OmpA family protein [Leisingera sp. SS27]|uniref:phosphate ABC transporter substrate-binding/OmpA family protein n=1 Tax=Leisingera sp. SS27 TaxID=2979462 RepID=UPI00232E9C64|nr:phosphate ABC transporter substrate-binding/OmpA family protein [Leisingera sp. SS27]MDC0659324.1 phosphate ABC transporter substrate-binding/OmpA family protein [Leisingera sp. SS27]